MVKLQQKPENLKITVHNGKSVCIQAQHEQLEQIISLQVLRAPGLPIVPVKIYSDEI